jgi:hypothetical protein
VLAGGSAAAALVVVATVLPGVSPPPAPVGQSLALAVPVSTPTADAPPTATTPPTTIAVSTPPQTAAEVFRVRASPTTRPPATTTTPPAPPRTTAPPAAAPPAPATAAEAAPVAEAKPAGGSCPSTLDGTVPHAARAGHHLAQRYGIPAGSLIGRAGRAGKSDHPSGHAIDFMVNRATGDKLADYALAHMDELGVKYVIWRQRYNDGSGWDAMEDRGDATANHMDHVHVSFDGSPPPGGGLPC